MKSSRTNTLLLFLFSTLLVPGCKEPLPDPPAQFEPNLSLAYQLAEGDEEYLVFMNRVLGQCDELLTKYYGSPDEAKLPEFEDFEDDYATLLSKEHLQSAAGPANAEGRGLYRKHCVTCHGATGNGRGTAAALINPYPRDYRLGKFKFKSTTRGSKPLKADIASVIKHGIPGTGMNPIPALSDKDIDALTDYVIYLSIRGESERKFLDEAAYEEVDIYDSSLPEDDEEFEEQIGFAEEVTLDMFDNWLKAKSRVKEVPERDPSVVPDTIAEVLAAKGKDSPINASIERGAKLFVSDATGCSKCHGKTGLGDGQKDTYDDWSKDLAKLSPAAQIPLIARGALPPKTISPRNFQQGVFRGGHQPEQLYQRILNGIEGTPMPAAAVGITPENIWDLINFVRSLHVPQEGTPAAETPSV